MRRRILALVIVISFIAFASNLFEELSCQWSNKEDLNDLDDSNLSQI